MVKRFTEESENKENHFFVRDKYEHLLKILGEHNFWNNQAIELPVKKIKEGEIRKYVPSEVEDEPIALPPGFEWSTFDCDNDQEVEEICSFLEEHYVEDQVGNFRLKYSKEKFRWGCASPGYLKELDLCIRNSKNKKILATIIGVPKKIVLNGKTVKLVEVNFLAIHRNLRNKRMA